MTAVIKDGDYLLLGVVCDHVVLQQIKENIKRLR